MGASALKQLDIGDNGRERSKSVQNGCYFMLGKIFTILDITQFGFE